MVGSVEYVGNVSKLLNSPPQREAIQRNTVIPRYGTVVLAYSETPTQFPLSCVFL